MTSDNLNIILTNALCCSATKAVLLSDKLSKGILCLESEKRELKLLNDRIEILKCYKFEINNTISNTILTLGDKDFTLDIVSTNLKEYTIIINGISYIKIGDGVKKISELVTEQLITLGYYISSSIVVFNDVVYVRYVLTCQVDSITVNVEVGSKEVPQPRTTTAVINQIGVCGTVDEINCLTADQMDQMAHEIMEYCDICDCQLTQ